MTISESTLSRWSHHQAATAFTQAHLPIRAALDAYKWPSEIKYEVFLQGSYKNDTNLGGDSDVDVVVRLNQRLRPRVTELSGRLLQEDASHQGAYRRWKSFRDHALKAMRARFGNAAESGRKTLKVPKGKIPADADLVVTLRYSEGIAFYLPNEEHWVVSFPQQHHDQGQKKEEATGRRFKRTVRMFKAARNRLVEKTERPGGPVWAGAGAVVGEEGAGVGQGAPRALGRGGLRVEDSDTDDPKVEVLRAGTPGM